MAAPRGHDLAVEQRAAAAQRVEGAGERAEPGRPVEPGAGVEPLAATPERDQAAIAVELGLVQPVVALRRLVDQRRELRLAERGSGAGALRRPAVRASRRRLVVSPAGPDGAGLVPGDRVHGAARRDAVGEPFRQPVRRLGRGIVALLDQQPVLALFAAAPVRARPHADQRPAALHALAVDEKCSMPAFSPSAGSCSGSQLPRSHIITVPPPYSPCGIVPSKSP